MNITLVREEQGYMVELKHLNGMTYAVLYIDLKNHKTKMYTGTKEECLKILDEKYNVRVSVGIKPNDEYDDEHGIAEYKGE